MKSAVIVTQFSSANHIIVYRFILFE